MDELGAETLARRRRNRGPCALGPQDFAVARRHEAPGQGQPSLGDRQGAVLRRVGHHLVDDQGEDAERAVIQTHPRPGGDDAIGRRAVSVQAGLSLDQGREVAGAGAAQGLIVGERQGAQAPLEGGRVVRNSGGVRPGLQGRWI